MAKKKEKNEWSGGEEGGESLPQKLVGGGTKIYLYYTAAAHDITLNQTAKVLLQQFCRRPASHNEGELSHGRDVAGASCHIGVDLLRGRMSAPPGAACRGAGRDVAGRDV